MPIAERRNSESDSLKSFNSYLDRQNETLDLSDLRRLAEFLKATDPSPLQLDWSRVIESVGRLASANPLARRLETELKRRTITADVAAQAVAESVAAISPQPLRVAFLVGAGASCAKPTEIPAVRDLLPMLWNKAAEIGHKPLLRIRDQCERLGVRHIEDLLTAIALAQAAMGNRITLQLVSRLITGRHGEPQEDAQEELFEVGRFPHEGVRFHRPLPESVDSGVVDSLRESTQTLFAVLVGMMVGKPPNQAHKSMAELCAACPGATIVTTNYDTCLEGALGEGAYTYGHAGATRQSETRSTTRLAKLHGSLNWYSCVNCHRFFPARLDEISRAFSEGLYPIISICPSCQATAQQLVVPPIAQKFYDHPMLLDIRRVAEDAFREANAVFIVGYSFNETDEYILRMISRATQQDTDKLFVILDTEAQPRETLATFLQTHVRAFNAKDRVQLILGDASVTMPLVCKAITHSLAVPETPSSGAGELPIRPSLPLETTTARS